MGGFTLYKLGRIRNKWITDGLSEVLSTFILAIFVYGSGAQAVLTNGAASSVTGRALAAGCGLALAVFCGFSASGPSVNPSIALMFCLVGKLQWRKYFLYVVCEFIGAYIAAAVTYGVYSDMLDAYDGGTRYMFGQNATVQIFTSFPRAGVSKQAGFFDIVVGCGLLTSLTAMIADERNCGASKGQIPLALVFMLFGIILAFGVNTGAAINFSIDLSGRIFAYTAGYGSEVFSHKDYWFWVPPVACYTGTILFTTIYHLMVANHLVKPEEAENQMTLNVDDVKSNGTSSAATSVSVLSIEDGGKLTLQQRL